MIRLSPTELLEKVAALIPPPKAHLTIYSGVFAPSAALRKVITLKPGIKKGMRRHSEDPDKPRLVKNSPWAIHLARVFKIDVSTCPECQGEMQIMAAIINPDEVARYLTHVGLAARPPPVAPAKVRQMEFEFFAE
jgi:hypothetical protein